MPTENLPYRLVAGRLPIEGPIAGLDRNLRDLICRLADPSQLHI